MENRTILFQGKEIDVDDEPGETSDMIHHPDHYTWKGTECKKVIEIMTQGLSGAEAYYMGNIIKYLYRYPKKGTLLSDLAKAEEYTKFLRELFIEDGWQEQNGLTMEEALAAIRAAKTEDAPTIRRTEKQLDALRAKGGRTVGHGVLRK